MALVFSSTGNNDVFEVYHEPIKWENNRRGQWSKWQRIAFLPLEFEVQFSTETISVTAIWEPWLSLSLSPLTITLTSGEQFARWCLYGVKWSPHFSCYNLHSEAQICYFLHSVCLFLVLPHLFPSLLFYFEGVPTRLPQLNWSPHPPMTDRPRIYIDDDISTLKHTLYRNSRIYMVDKWVEAVQCFLTLSYNSLFARDTL